MVTLIDMTCPSCGAALSIEKGTAQFFCQYCGTKIALNDENAQTFRYIDEAEMTRAQAELAVQLRKLQLEEEKLRNERESELRYHKDKRFAVIVWLSSMAILFSICILGFEEVVNEEIGIVFLLLGLLDIVLGGLIVAIKYRRRQK